MAKYNKYLAIVLVLGGIAGFIESSFFTRNSKLISLVLSVLFVARGIYEYRKNKENKDNGIWEEFILNEKGAIPGFYLIANIVIFIIGVSALWSTWREFTGLISNPLSLDIFNIFRRGLLYLAMSGFGFLGLRDIHKLTLHQVAINRARKNKTNKTTTYHRKEKRPKSGYRQEDHSRMSGQVGEAKVDYALTWIDNNKYTTYKNIILKYQEIDNIVVGENGIFNIEVKHFSGDDIKIVIDEEGNWLREKNGQISAIENPLFQVHRHRKVIEDTIGTEYPIIDVVVLANERNILEGSKNSPLNIVKLNTLQYFIESYQQERKLTPEELKKINKELRAHKQPGRTFKEKVI